MLAEAVAKGSRKHLRKQKPWKRACVRSTVTHIFRLRYISVVYIMLLLLAACCCLLACLLTCLLAYLLACLLACLLCCLLLAKKKFLLGSTEKEEKGASPGR